jgi:hypothetical protein
MYVCGVSTNRAWYDVLWLDTVLPAASRHQIIIAPTLSSCTVYGPTHSPAFEGVLCSMLYLAPAPFPRRFVPASMSLARRVAASVPTSQPAITVRKRTSSDQREQEIRNSKLEIRNKFKSPKGRKDPNGSCMFRIFFFEHSVIVSKLRYSDLEFLPWATTAASPPYARTPHSARPVPASQARHSFSRHPRSPSARLLHPFPFSPSRDARRSP